MASRKAGENYTADDASPQSGNTGESRHSRYELPRGGLSRDNSLEYIGTIRRTFRILSRLLDHILLSVLGARVRPTLGA